MELKKYKELKAKAMQQMGSEVKEIKMTCLEQWLFENGYGNISFASYEDAKKWIEENVTDSKKRRDFYKTEEAVDEVLQGIMKDLEFGSSSKGTKVARKVAHKYIIPAAKVVLSAVILNYLATKGVEIGLRKVSQNLYEKMTSWPNNIKLLDKESLQGIKENLLEFLEAQGKGILEKFTDSIIPFAKKITSAAVGLLEIVGIYGINKKTKYIRKLREVKNKNEDLENENSELKEQIREGNAGEEKNEIKGKREAALKNTGKYQQMQYIVNELKKFFKDGKIDIPDIPVKCVSMEEYGKKLRESLQSQNIPPIKRQEVYAVLDIYKNSIEYMCSELRLGKCGIVKNTMRTIEGKLQQIKSLALDIADGTSYTIKQFVRVALKKGTGKSDVTGARDSQINDRENGNIEEHN